MATAYPRTTFVLGGKVTNTRKGAIDLSELEKVAANLMYYACLLYTSDAADE